jgi:hypothetical protein
MRSTRSLDGRSYDDIPLSLETIPPASAQPPESEDDLPTGFAAPVRRELRELLADVPPDNLRAVARAWAAIEEFGALAERDVADGLLPFVEEFAARARAAREQDVDLFVVSWD